MMMNSKFLFSKRFLLLLIVIQGSSAAECQTCHQPMIDRAVTKEQLDNDFENNGVFPWVEESQNGVQWKIENKTSPWEMKNIAPQPLSGENYLRIHRGMSFSSFGVAVLRSPTFTLLPGQINFSFSFWIRSKWSQFTNLELYMAKDGNERLLITLHNYSNINNRIWLSVSVPLNDALPSNISLVFYAYCGTETEDAVAIDNLQFLSKELTTLSPSTLTSQKVSTTITHSKTTSRSITPYTTSIETPTTKPSTNEPSTTGASITGLTTTHQPLTDAPITEPPTTEPPTTEPPTTEPPTTEPPTTGPPATEPPATEPPATEPPGTEPPATEPPTTEPPIETTTRSTYPTSGACICPTVGPCYFPVNPNYCIPQYYTCSYGSGILLECPDPDVFDPLYSSCIHPLLASCNSKIKLLENRSRQHVTQQPLGPLLR